ncbi:hypothetical protein FHY18_004314 [Xanthomonas arboricola]|nr:hypothetical protein [Xanthomonas sp. 3793]
MTSSPPATMATSPRAVCKLPDTSALPPLRKVTLAALTAPASCAALPASTASAPPATVLPPSAIPPRARKVVSPRWLPISPRLSSCAASTVNAFPATTVPLLTKSPATTTCASRAAVMLPAVTTLPAWSRRSRPA